MKPASFFAALSGLLLSSSFASAGSLARVPGNDDTIMVKLPNQVSMTIVARNKQQLREMKNYKLDSLMTLLDAYITQAEAAGRKGSNGQVTMEFYPAKDKPGSTAAPEQVRVTVRGSKPNADRVEVFMNKKLGVTVENSEDANGDNVKVTINSDAKSDSVKHAKRESKRNKLTGTDFGVDLGLNALVNKKTYAPAGVAQPYDLRTWGSRYVALNWKFWARTGRNSPLYFHLGPEVAFNNYMLEGSRYFAANDAAGRTDIVKDDVRNLEKSKLAVTTLNLPVGFTLKFRDKDNDEVFRIGAGGFAGYRIGAHTKLKYEQEGRTHKDKDRGSYNLEDFQYGLSGSLGVKGFDLFVKYNLNDVFKADRGPKAQNVSFGITFSDI
ncbi:outer membrane beta-barrel protein [Hymenobacter jeollabukensis]|uniref:PorT family protein n=1 Tax=Hymenobacter jeollabukensis TaxID=2025313 RepID=A0A5R8WP09_9BACT|nr:outer membrane beta-barrel protein [Hymenobacter jeollabukensis]TLM91716.1 PorT family protein [Hymenobacter jeollabukensis]